MSRKDAARLASRALAVLLILWALSEASYLPERLHSFLHYTNDNLSPATSAGYRSHYYLVSLGFLVVRIVGFSLAALWLYRGGPEVDELLSPSPTESA